MYDICIIGAGQSGLTTCKTFIEKKYNVIVLEKSNSNGLFNTIKEKGYFKWSTSRSMSGFSDFPMPKNLPDWFTIQNYDDYLNSYKKHFDLEKYIHYNSKVISCKQNEFEEWIVSYNEGGNLKQLLCKKLIISTGLNNTPKFPEIVKNYTGEIIHTDYIYRNMTKQDWQNKFSGKKVLLLGGGESAFDIGHIVVQYTNNFYFASKDYIEWFPQGSEEEYNIKRIKQINNKCLNIATSPDHSFDYKPTDTNLIYAEYSLPELFSEIWHTSGRNIVLPMFYGRDCGKCSHQHKELCDKTETPNDLFKKYVVKRTSFIVDIYENRVKIVYYPDKIENKTIFTRDKIIKDVDIIVCSTGYKKEFPFLDFEITNDNLIKKMVLKNKSNIAFVGYARPTMGSIASIAEMQSWWIESYFANRLSYRIRNPIFRFKDPLNLDNEHINTLVIGCYYLKDLAKDMNIEPNMIWLFLTDFELFKKIYTGSCHPMIYRIHGEKSYPESRNVLINTFYDFDNEKANMEKIYLFIFIGVHILFIIFIGILSYFLTFLFGKKSKFKKNFQLIHFCIFIGLLVIFYEYL